MRKRIITAFWKYVQANNVLLNVGILIAYVILGKFGLSFASINPSATALWAPTGIALASLLLFGYRVTPAIFLGAFIVNIATAGGLGSSFGIALGNTLEGVTGTYLVRRFANGVLAFDSVLTIFKFIFFAALMSTTVSATIGVITLIFAHLAVVANFWPVWFTWWLGDMGGNMVVAPIILVWTAHHNLRFFSRGVIHFFASSIALIILTEVVFLGVLPYPYLTIPLAVWIAFWFGRRGATITTLFVAAIAIWDTIHGMGPFGHEATINQSLVLLELFLSVFSLTGLVFAATVLQTSRSQKEVTIQGVRFKALIEKSFDAVVLIDATSRISYASPTFEKIVGYSPHEIEGKIGLDLVHPDDRTKTARELASLILKPGGTVTVEYRTIRKDGKIIWVEATGTNLLFDPSVNAVVVNFHDITDRKIAATKLQEEKLEDEAMLGSIGDGIIATDSKGIITMANTRALEMLGYDKKELIGQAIVTAIPMQVENGKILPIKDRPMTKVLTLGKEIVTSSEVYYIKKDKSVFPVHFTVTPIILDRKIVGAIEVFQDITKEKEVDKAKTEFVSLASHQLRTPLATINWYLEELIKNGSNLSEKQGDYLKEVYSASRRMVDLINALLNTSRLELGTFTVEPVDTDIVKIAKEVLKDLSPKIDAKQVVIQERYAKNLPAIKADAKLLAIIMQNLLSNAIKYTKEKDTITLEVTFNEKEFVIKISDKGYGIPKSQQDKIFTKLFRADNARTIEPEGSGLGLYIVKSIIDAAGGKIWFDSEENKGTTFFVSFPASGMKKRKGDKGLI